MNHGDDLENMENRHGEKYRIKKRSACYYPPRPVAGPLAAEREPLHQIVPVFGARRSSSGVLHRAA